MIVAMDIGCSFYYDNGFWTSWEGSEPWYYFEDGGMSLWITLLLIQAPYPFIFWLGKCAYAYMWLLL